MNLPALLPTRSLARERERRQTRPRPIRQPTVSGVLRRWGPWVGGMALIAVDGSDVPITARFWRRRHVRHLVFWGGDDMAMSLLIDPVLFSMTYQTTPYRGANGLVNEVEEHGPDTWQYFIVSPRSTVWDSRIIGATICGGTAESGSRIAANLLPRLLGELQRRQQTGRATPKIITVLHDMKAFWEPLPPVARAAFRPLLQHGPRHGLHFFITAKYADYDLLPIAHLLQATNIFGSPMGQPVPNRPLFRPPVAAGLLHISPQQALWSSNEGWEVVTVPIAN